MLDMLCELAGVELFKYPGKLQDLAFLKRKTAMCLPALYPHFNAARSDPRRGCSQSPLEEGGEGTPGSTCQGSLVA